MRLRIQRKWSVPKKIKWVLVVCLSITGPASVSAQTKVTETEEQFWVAYFNQSRLSKRWGLWLDVHLRTKENLLSGFSQLLARPGVTYYITDDLRLTASYAFINHFPADNHKNISQPEHRPWQQLQWQVRYPKVRMMQWLRLEERFRRKIKNDNELAEGYLFNWRIRYNFLAQFPLSKKKFQPGTLSLVVGDELFVNFGKQVTYNYFDQNRLFAGFHYHVNKSDNLQFGYMNVFLQLAAGNRYRSLHTARVFYFHNLDLRKKQ